MQIARRARHVERMHLAALARRPDVRLGRDALRVCACRGHLRRAGEVGGILVYDLRNVQIVLQEKLLEAVDARLVRTVFARHQPLLQHLRRRRADGLAEGQDRGLHTRGAEGDVRHADVAPRHHEVGDVHRIEAAERYRVHRHARMVLPVPVASGVVYAERIMCVERPSAVRNAVLEHLALEAVVRRQDVVANEAVPLAASVHMRHLEERVAADGVLFGPFVLEPSPVCEVDAHKLVARALRVRKVVEPAAMLQPPLAFRMPGPAREPRGEYPRPHGRLVWDGLVADAPLLVPDVHVPVAVELRRGARKAAAHREVVAHIGCLALVVFCGGLASVHPLRAGEDAHPAVARAVDEKASAPAAARAVERAAGLHGRDARAVHAYADDALVVEHREVRQRIGHLPERA